MSTGFNLRQSAGDTTGQGHEATLELVTCVTVMDECALFFFICTLFFVLTQVTQNGERGLMRMPRLKGKLRLLSMPNIIIICLMYIYSFLFLICIFIAIDILILIIYL